MPSSGFWSLWKPSRTTRTPAAGWPPGVSSRPRTTTSGGSSGTTRSWSPWSTGSSNNPHARGDCHQKALKAGERDVIGRVATRWPERTVPSSRSSPWRGSGMREHAGFRHPGQCDIGEPVSAVNHPDNVGVRRRLAVGPEHGAADRMFPGGLSFAGCERFPLRSGLGADARPPPRPPRGAGHAGQHGPPRPHQRAAPPLAQDVPQPAHQPSPARDRGQGRRWSPAGGRAPGATRRNPSPACRWRAPSRRRRARRAGPGEPSPTRPAGSREGRTPASWLTRVET